MFHLLVSKQGLWLLVLAYKCSGVDWVLLRTAPSTLGSYRIIES